MRAIFISFEDSGTECRHRATLQGHTQSMESCPELLLSMALSDGSRHGILHIFTSDDAAERFFEDHRFRTLARLDGCHDFFVRRYEVVAHATSHDTEVVERPGVSQTDEISGESPPGKVEGSGAMAHHEAIAAYLRDLAGYYRLRHAEDGEVPDVTRASDLEHFASYVENLPPEDPRLSTLARLTWLELDGVISPGPHFSAALADLSTFPMAGYDALLDHLVHSAIDDVIEQNRSMVETFSTDLAASLR